MILEVRVRAETVDEMVQALRAVCRDLRRGDESGWLQAAPYEFAFQLRERQDIASPGSIIQAGKDIKPAATDGGR